MTLTNEKRLIRHEGNGATTNFPYDFLIPDANSVIVSLWDEATDTTTVLNASQYNITGLGDPNFGEVTYPLSGSPIAAGTWLVIEREVAYTQDLLIKNQGGFFADSTMAQLDRIVMQTQQLAETLERTPKFSPGSGVSNVRITQGDEGTVLIWGADGNIVKGPSTTEIESAQTYAAEAKAARDEAEVAQQAAEDAADRAEQVASSVEYPVSYAPQTLDPSERAQARENIAAVGYEEQSLSPAEQGQARANIGVGHTFNTVAALLADETMSYTPGAGLIEVGPGDIIEAQGFRYEVAASDAVDAHVETAGGVKLRYLPSGKWRFEAFGADPSGETPAGDEVLKAIQVAALETERITFDATGAIFDLTGTHIKSVADGAKICVEGGKFIREDNSSLSTALFHFAQYAEVIFLYPEFDMGYKGSTDIDEYIDGAQCVACFGCDYFYVTGAKGGHTRGDFLYTSRDTASNGGGTNRNTGTVIWVNNTPHNCKRNYFAVTDAMFYNVSDNTCTSDGDDGNGSDYVWARSAVIDFEPNNTLDALGYGVCNNNVLRVKGAKNPIRWAVGTDKIPHTYKAIECNGNTIDCTGVQYSIAIEARGALELLNLAGNKSTKGSAANTAGILVIGFTGKATCDNNIVYCRSGAENGIYFNTGSAYQSLPQQADVSITGGSVEMLDSGSTFRGVRANGGVGAMFRVIGVSCVAVDSSNQAVQIFGASSDNKLSQAVVTGCSGRFFSGGINIQNASKALATGNTAGSVSGSGNTVEEFSANL